MEDKPDVAAQVQQLVWDKLNAGVAVSANSLKAAELEDEEEEEEEPEV
jgi:hypothetical protein